MAIIGAALLLPDGVAQATGTASGNAATSTLINVTIDSVPALKLHAFHGTFATSAVGQNDGDDAADTAQDPAGVLKHVTINGSAQSKTYSDPAKTWARSQVAAAYSLHGKPVYTIDSLDSYADCTSAYVHEDGVKVLGTTIPAGKTTAVPVTGSQIGVRHVDHGTLEVTYTTTAAAAHAHLDLSITGSFYSSAGRKLYSGPIQTVRFGDVQVTCASSPPTSPAPSTAPVPPTSSAGGATVTAASNGPADPDQPALPQPAKPASSESSAQGESSPGHRSQHAAHPPGAGGSDPAAPGNGSMQRAAETAALPHTSGISVWWIVLSGLGLGGGILLYFATRRRGGHQQ